MTCRDVAEILLDYLEGALAQEQCGAIRAHLECCHECVDFVETYSLTIQITRRLPPAELPPALLEKMRRALEES
jgi:predicted anti-sigma-YlaC factor YlaD